MQAKQTVQELQTNRGLFLMAVPIFVELMLQLLVGNMDQVMVGYVDQKSVASIVNANQVMNLVIIVLTMASSAATIVLSQYIGAGDRGGESRTGSAALAVVTVCGAIISLSVMANAGRILQAIHVPAEIFGETKQYLTVVSSMILAQGLYLTLSAMVRAFAYMKEIMYVSVLMNAVNIAGNALLINGWLGFPQLGALGAAIATDVSKLVGLALMIRLYVRRVGVPVGIRFLRPFPRDILKHLCALAIPTGIESFSYNFSQVCIQGVINRFGTMAAVTKGYCGIFANLDYIYAMALGSAVQVVLGYMVGAGRTREIEKRVMSAVKLAVLLCVLMAVILFAGSNWFFLVFTGNPEVIALGRRILMIEILTEAGRAVNIIMTKCLIAVGDVMTPTIVGIAFHWCVAFAGAWLLGYGMGMGLAGVWIAMTADECARGIIYVLHFQKGKWADNF